MDAILKILRTIGPTTAGTAGEKAWNVLWFVLGAAAAITVGACKLGLPVPGVDCSVIQAAETQQP